MNTTPPPPPSNPPPPLEPRNFTKSLSTSNVGSSNNVVSPNKVVLRSKKIEGKPNEDPRQPPHRYGVVLRNETLETRTPGKPDKPGKLVNPSFTGLTSETRTTPYYMSDVNKDKPDKPDKPVNPPFTGLTSANPPPIPERHYEVPHQHTKQHNRTPALKNSPNS